MISLKKKLFVKKATPSDLGTATLEVKSKTFSTISHHSLNRFVEKVYGKEWDFCYDGLGEDNFYFFNVKKDKTDKWVSQIIEKWQKEDGRVPTRYVILQSLCDKGFITEGQYLITVE